MRILQTRKRLIQIISYTRAQNQRVLDVKNKLINEMQLEIEAQRMHEDVWKKKLQDEIDYLEKVMDAEDEDHRKNTLVNESIIRKLKEENEELLGFKHKYISFIKNRRIR